MMQPDRWRLLLCVAVSLLAGFAVGAPFLGLSVGLLVFLLWYHGKLAGFLNYARHGAEDNLPDVPGIINELIREFHELQSLSRQRDGMLTGVLQRFQDAAAALPDAVVVTDKDGAIEWANSRAAQYLGVHWPEDSGQRLSNLIRHPDLAAYIKRHHAATTPDVLELVSPEDETLQLEIRVSVYGNAYLLLVARDITELHRINKMRRDFIANASHELRTPLTVIAGYLESFDEDPDNCPPEWAGKIAQMRMQATRMQRLIEDLLRLSSLETAPDQDLREEVPVRDLLGAIHREAVTLDGDGGHRFSLDVDPTLWLRGSQRDLYSAFSNIVFNAVQHTPGSGEIFIKWRRDAGGAVLEVSDTGEGIAPEHIPRLTERFYRVDKSRSRSRGGTGLGLAIAKHALARHEAELEISSELGTGSTFICRFPADRVLVRGRLRASASG
ncbi:MAG TPA: phosphate regulon sensor histidine kinase PhoR [Gammaproteobacteria bacterium]